jgi:hypothetical protein
MKIYHLKTTIILLLLALFPMFASADVPDAYEPDNSIENATILLLNKGYTSFPKPDYETTQDHNFYDEDDIDWYQFYAKKENTYVLEIKSVGMACDPVIEIYDSDGLTFNSDVWSQPIDINFNGQGEYAEWVCSKTDIYYARIRQCDNNIEGCNVHFGDNTQYKILLYYPILVPNSLLYGTIQPPIKAIVTLDNGDGSLSLPNGQFYIPAQSGTYTLKVEATGFLPYTQSIVLNALESTAVTVSLRDNSVQKIDMFEPDNTFEMAQVIDLTHEKHVHTFYPHGDSDKSIFYAIAEQCYTITMEPSDSQLDVAFYILEVSGNHPNVKVDNAFPGETEEIIWTCPAQGLYYLSAFQSNDITLHDPTYTLSIGSVESTDGIIHGKIVDHQTQEALTQVVITSMTGESALSHDDGSFYLPYRGELPLRIFSRASEYSESISIVENPSEYLFIELQKQMNQTNQHYVLEQMWPVSVHPRSYPYQCDFESYEWQIDIAQYKNQYMFRIDSANSRIQKFNIFFQLMKQWGKEGSGPGEFNGPKGLAVSENYLFVCDTQNYRIQQFSLNGDFIDEWGEFGSNEKEFDLPTGIAVDDNNCVYVADTGNHRVQVFSSDGTFLTQFGESGKLPGQMKNPQSIFIMDNHIHVSELNGRIQIFRPVDKLPKHRAILVSADQVSSVSSFNQAIKTNVHFAYRTLMAQGLTKARIDILSNDIYDDMDGNSINDDSTNLPSLENLQAAILNSSLETETLLIYLTGLSGNTKFKINSSELLIPQQLDAWLDEFQQMTESKVVLIMDSDDAHEFMSQLTPLDEDNFVRICSTSQNENAAFLNKGLVSFSTYFWTEIMNGQNLLTAFSQSTQAISLTGLQTPQLIYAEPDALTTWFIGNGTSFGISSPVIQNTDEAHAIEYSQGVKLSIDNITDIDSIADAFAVILPPAVKEGNVSLFDLPVQVLSQTASQSFEACYTGFYAQGQHTILFYAMDQTGTLSLPVLKSFTYKGTVPYKAMIIIERTISESLRTTFQGTASRIYNILTHQGYQDDDIMLFSDHNFSTKVDQKSSRQGIMVAIDRFADNELEDVLIYLIGEKCSPFYLSEYEVLYPDDINVSIDNLQSQTSCHVTVIYDAGNASRIYKAFVSNARFSRTIIGSTGKNQTALFSPESQLSFSYFFWQKIQSGCSLWDAFYFASSALRAFDIYPGLDTNGDGEASEVVFGLFSNFSNDDPNIYPGDCITNISDGIISYPIIFPPISSYTDPTDKNIAKQRKLLHHPIQIKTPVIMDASTYYYFWQPIFPISLKNRDYVNLEVNSIQSLNPIEKVFAVVYEENDLFSEYPLRHQQGTYYQRKQWCSNVGTRYIQMFARDNMGNVSNPKFIKVLKATFPIKGNINGNQLIDLEDLIMGLQVLSKTFLEDFRDDYIYVDPTSEGTLGMDDIIYIFEEISNN